MVTARRYTVEEARHALGRIVADAEAGAVVELVRGGTVVARIVPGGGRVGRGRGTGQVHGDLVAPLGEDWEVEHE